MIIVLHLEERKSRNVKETILTAYNSAVSSLCGAWDWLCSQVRQIRSRFPARSLLEKLNEISLVIYERATQQASSFLQRSMSGTQYVIARWAGTCAGVVMAAAIANQVSVVVMIVITIAFFALLAAMQRLGQVMEPVEV
jgi:hypothetical protein